MAPGDRHRVHVPGLGRTLGVTAHALRRFRERNSADLNEMDDLKDALSRSVLDEYKSRKVADLALVDHETGVAFVERNSVIVTTYKLSDLE